MSGNWYAKERGKAALARALLERGWTIHGWREDNSDAMSDYYDPEHWEGIASKDDTVLVVDFNYGFDGEQVVGGRIYATTHYLKSFGVAWQANPPRKNWHLERQGHIIASGNGIGSIDGYDTGKAALKRVLADIEQALTRPVVAATADTDKPAATADLVVTVSRNAAKNGIEIKFSSKPAESIIARLHAAGFRFSYQQSLWYAKDTPGRWDAAMTIYHAVMLRDALPEAQPAPSVAEAVPADAEPAEAETADEVATLADAGPAEATPVNTAAEPDIPAAATAADAAPKSWEARILEAAINNPDLVKPGKGKKQPAAPLETLPLFGGNVEAFPLFAAAAAPEPDPEPPTSLEDWGAGLEWDVAHRYTQQEAVEDGTLVDLSEQAYGMGFTVPFFVTNAVYAEAISPDGDTSARRSLVFLAFVKGALRNLQAQCPTALDTDLLEFSLHLPLVGVAVERDGERVEPEERTLWLHLGAGDDGGAVYTLMFPGDW